MHRELNLTGYALHLGGALFPIKSAMRYLFSRRGLRFSTLLKYAHKFLPILNSEIALNERAKEVHTRFYFQRRTDAGTEEIGQRQHNRESCDRYWRPQNVFNIFRTSSQHHQPVDPEEQYQRSQGYRNSVLPITPRQLGWAHRQPQHDFLS